jgi:hypothetical protein
MERGKKENGEGGIEGSVLLEFDPSAALYNSS